MRRRGPAPSSWATASGGQCRQRHRAAALVGEQRVRLAGSSTAAVTRTRIGASAAARPAAPARPRRPPGRRPRPRAAPARTARAQRSPATSTPRHRHHAVRPLATTSPTKRLRPEPGQARDEERRRLAAPRARRPRRPAPGPGTTSVRRTADPTSDGRHRLQQLLVQRARLRRGIGAEGVGQRRAARLVQAQGVLGLAEVAVGAHQHAVGGLRAGVEPQRAVAELGGVAEPAEPAGGVRRVEQQPLEQPPVVLPLRGGRRGVRLVLVEVARVERQGVPRGLRRRRRADPAATWCPAVDASASKASASTQTEVSTRPPVRRTRCSAPRTWRAWDAAVRRLARPRSGSTSGHSASTRTSAGTTWPAAIASSRTRSRVLLVRHDDGVHRHAACVPDLEATEDPDLDQLGHASPCAVGPPALPHDGRRSGQGRLPQSAHGRGPPSMDRPDYETDRPGGSEPPVRTAAPPRTGAGSGLPKTSASSRSAAASPAAAAARAAIVGWCSSRTPATCAARASSSDGAPPGAAAQQLREAELVHVPAEVRDERPGAPDGGSDQVALGEDPDQRGAGLDGLQEPGVRAVVVSEVRRARGAGAPAAAAPAGRRRGGTARSTTTSSRGRAASAARTSSTESTWRDADVVQQTTSARASSPVSAAHGRACPLPTSAPRRLDVPGDDHAARRPAVVERRHHRAGEPARAHHEHVRRRGRAERAQAQRDRTRPPGPPCCPEAGHLVDLPRAADGRVEGRSQRPHRSSLPGVRPAPRAGPGRTPPARRGCATPARR